MAGTNAASCDSVPSGVAGPRATITVPGVYEGDGVLKLEKRVDLKEQTKVK
jgi:hypothetical protein